jgi:periplasmic protein TonB
MFEQSMLLDHADGKKTGALAASIMIQSLVVGVLVLVPLFYGDRLPMVQPILALVVPVSRPPAPQQVESAPAQTSKSSLAPPRVYRPLMSTAVASSEPVMIDAGAPAIGVIGPPPSMGSGDVLPSIIAAPPPARKAAPVEALTLQEKPVPVGGDVQAAKLIRKIVPQYPPLARSARVSGTVHLLGVIAKDGTIQQLRVVSGSPLLVQAAVNAVRQWIYRPTTLNGSAVEVIAPIDVIFSLQ